MVDTLLVFISISLNPPMKRHFMEREVKIYEEKQKVIQRKQGKTKPVNEIK